MLGENILLFAPHPDDETICLGGWLFDRIASGAQVWAVVVTDGEAFTKALRVRRKIKPSFLFRPHDYRVLGKLRREEASNSLNELGVPPARRIFLGYPSGILSKVVSSKNPKSLFRSKATKQRFGIGEWGLKNRKLHPYSRASMEADFQKIILLANPDIVLLPHPVDFNEDHRAVAKMVLGELSNIKRKSLLMAYLVHHGSRNVFPKPYGYRPSEGILPPRDLPLSNSYFPSKPAIKAKEKAINCHVSQIRLRDGFLISFIRRQEIFWRLMN
ncbi:PIG-L family deacetylase [bacterium]|nr:PIG-L family deacetylase [bacterium]